MPITLNDLTELREKISEGRKKLEEQEAALIVLESMVSESNVNSKEEIKLGALPTKQSIVDNVLDIIDRFGEQEFMVVNVEDALKEQGKLPKSKSPRASIAMALQKIEAQNEIVRTYKGRGNEPHRFKKASGIKELKVIQNEG